MQEDLLAVQEQVVEELAEHQLQSLLPPVLAGCPSAVYVIHESASWLNRLRAGRARVCSSVRSMLTAGVRVLG